MPKIDPSTIRSVLIIDNNPDFRYLFRLALKAIHGCRVIEAADGSEGTRVVQSELPDVIFIAFDVLRQSGFEILHTLQETPNTAAIPLVLISGSREHNDLDQARALCQGYLRKPISLYDIKGWLRQFG